MSCCSSTRFWVGKGWENCKLVPFSRVTSKTGNGVQGGVKSGCTEKKVRDDIKKKVESRSVTLGKHYSDQVSDRTNMSIEQTSTESRGRQER